MTDGKTLDRILNLQGPASYPKPVKCLENCFIGPSKAERAGKDPWGATSNRKRQRVDDGTVSESSVSISLSFDNAMKMFLASGCCVIPNVLPKDFVSRSLEVASSDLEYLSLELQNRRSEALQSNQDHLLARAARADFRELVDRDGGRRDVRFQLDRFPFIAPGLVYNPIVYPLVRELLGGGEVNLLYAGVMWALPQPKPKKAAIDSVSQKWHSDGGHLFSHAHLPPHCINVFYPLVDLHNENGPTEVMPGSHRLGKLNDPTASKFGLCCDAGSAILFDYRLNHRGGANFTSEPRPILYLAYAKPFFRDAGNIRSGHSIIAQSPTSKPSPAWVARILSGNPVRMGEGFDWHYTPTSEQISEKVDAEVSASAALGSGERWILFKMNIEIPGCSEPKVIVVHHGDVASEVATQFCRENEITDDFAPMLTASIQNQMNSSLQEGNQ